MDVTISGDVAKELLARTRKDSKLASVLARQWMSQVDRRSLGDFLLDEATAHELLTRRLSKAPEQTITELQRMPTSNGAGRGNSGQTPRSRANRSAGRDHRTKQRVRLTTRQVSNLKDRIRSFLAGRAQATRAQIVEAANVPTQSVYNRVMNELRAEGVVIAEGERSKRIYKLASPASKAKSNPSSPSKTKPSRRKTSKKQRSQKKASRRKASKKRASKKRASKKKASKKKASKKKAAG